MLILSFIVTDDSCSFIKNLFSVLVSLFCGIVVAFCTVTIDVYQRSVSSYRRIIELASNAIQYIESEYVNQDNKIVSDYIGLRFEYTSIYRELCFISDSLAYDKEYRLLSKSFKSMVDYLASINDGIDIPIVKKTLSDFVEMIRCNLKPL